MSDGVDPLDLPPETLADVHQKDELTYRTVRSDHVDRLDPRRVPAVWRLIDAAERAEAASTSASAD